MLRRAFWRLWPHEHWWPGRLLGGEGSVITGFDIEDVVIYGAHGVQYGEDRCRRCGRER